MTMSFKGDVLVVRAAIVAPANVVANLFRRHAGEDIVENLDPSRQVCCGVGEIAALCAAVKGHCGVGRVELQIESRLNDRLVFRSQRGRGRLDVLLVRLIITVGKIERDLPRRNGRDKSVVRRCIAESRFKIADFFIYRLGVAHLDRSVQHGQAQVL